MWLNDMFQARGNVYMHVLRLLHLLLTVLSGVYTLFENLFGHGLEMERDQATTALACLSINLVSDKCVSFARVM